MTIASEIERLQCAKSDICTAIENKGVTVGDITLDNYACCIDCISTGADVKFVDLLVVGGGGDGGIGGIGYSGGGGGGGGIIYRTYFPLNQDSYTVVVGARKNNSCFGDLVAYAGGDGGIGTCYNGKAGNGGNGGGAGSTYYGCSYNNAGGETCLYQLGLQGRAGRINSYNNRGGGGGGYSGWADATSYIGGNGFTTDISGTSQTYGGGGGGGTQCSSSVIGIGGAGGGGCGMYCSNCGYANMAATYYGGGGGGSTWGCTGGNGCKGIVIVRYKTDGSCGINSATGGTKYTCGDYTIHCFTSSGTFCVVC